MTENSAEPSTPVQDVVMRLFVWNEFCPDYTAGLAFAVAADIEEAQRLVIKSEGFNPSNWGPVQVFDLKEPRAFSVFGGS
jgi:hypothetical protein